MLLSRIWLFILVLVSLRMAQAQGVPSIPLSQNPALSINLTDSLQAYTSLAQAPLSEIEKNQITEELGVNFATSEKSGWVIFNLINPSAHTKSLYIRPCSKAETFVLFSITESGEVSFQASGAGKNPSDKLLPTDLSYLLIHLKAREKLRLIAYTSFPINEANPHITEMRVAPVQMVNQEFTANVAFQFFYMGFIILLSLLALVAAFLLKQKAIFYYAMVMPFFIPYFLRGLTFNGIMFSHISWLSIYDLTSVALIFILFFGTLFFGEFLKLPRRMPRFWVVFFAYTLVCDLAILITLFTRPVAFINYFLTAWLLMAIWPAIRLSFKHYKSAYILLVSYSVLICGAVLYTLGMLGVIPSSTFAEKAFQIGTLLFSLILFYALSSRVNYILKEKAKADELSALKTRFFQDISHELRTPLSLMIDPVQKVAQDLPHGPAKELLATAHQASTGLLHLVNQILDLSKLEATAEEISFEPVEMTDFLKLQLGNFSSVAEERQIDLQFNTSLESIYLNINRPKMQQVISNLVSNALKFTPKGGKVNVALRQKNVQAAVEVSVSDTGHGISDRALPHIFDRYYQAPENIDSHTPGTGIGLALSKLIIEQHNARINVQSTLGKGSIFVISFPQSAVVPASAKASPAQTSEESISAFQVQRSNRTKNKRPEVLIIEDHPELRKYLVNRVGEHYRVVAAADGTVGLALALQQIPDVVISDLMMPGKNGYEITAALKADARTSHIPIILLTAKVSQESKMEGLQHGADDYLKSPLIQMSSC